MYVYIYIYIYIHIYTYVCRHLRGPLEAQRLLRELREAGARPVLQVLPLSNVAWPNLPPNKNPPYKTTSLGGHFMRGVIVGRCTTSISRAQHVDMVAMIPAMMSTL